MQLGLIPTRNSAGGYVSILLESWLLTLINVTHASPRLPSFATHELHSPLLRAEATHLENE